jgi:hypothetical protein
MSINPPRFPGPYSQRAIDCELAIKGNFLRETVNAATPCFDLNCVLSEIAGDATRSGWSEQELIDALMRLARRYNIKPSAQRLF